MAKKACELFGIKLNIVDISSEIERIFLGNGFIERPCRYCKGIMDRITVDFAVTNSYSLICVGDTKDDKTLINRMQTYDGFVSHISRYFNKSILLPEGI
jgi:tRNA(Ile)-lysidine synthase TilS/MesJ